jgi:HAD superfamily hydrolase (TIGR01450 family)
MVPVGGVTLLEHAAKAVPDGYSINVLLGYLAGEVTIQHPGLVKHINAVYRTTNNMYSLNLAREALAGRPFFLLNGDVYISKSETVKNVMAEAAAREHNVIMCDSSFFDDESMKVILDDNGNIVKLSKQISEQDQKGVSMDFYYITAATSTKLFEYIGEHLKRSVTDWTEVALQVLMDQGEVFKPLYVPAGTVWKEIDTQADLLDIHRDEFLDSFKRDPPKHLLVDLDGTVYRQGVPIPGAVEVANGWIRNPDVTIKFVTNNTSKTPLEYVKLLQHIGVEIKNPDDLVSPLDDVKAMLTENGWANAMVFGNPAVRSYLNHCDDQSKWQVIVITNNTSYTHADLCDLMNACRLDVPIVATHCDRMCPTPDGPVPDIGLVLDMVKQCTSKEPEVVFGKPYLRPGLNSDERTIVIGDNPVTDGQLATNHGFDFALVLSGRVNSPGDLANIPQYMLRSLADAAATLE